MSTALVHAGLTSLEKIEEINPRELEMVLLIVIPRDTEIVLHN